MRDALIIILAVIVVVTVAAIAWYAAQRRKTERLRERFGPEYDRAVKRAGDERSAQRELTVRQQRVAQLRIRDLDPEERRRFDERWQRVQARFVDDPRGAVDEADRLVGEVMEARGYPVADFDQRAADVSVDHPDVVENYRLAHGVVSRDEIDTEALRGAMVHYRALFADLLEAAPERRQVPNERMEHA